MTNNQPIIELLRTFGAKKGATPAQIALAWLMAQKPWIVPIPGTTKMDHLRENLDAVKVQLTPADLREIETAFSRIEIYGGRMDARQMAQIGQDGDVDRMRHIELILSLLLGLLVVGSGSKPVGSAVRLARRYRRGCLPHP